MGNLFPILSLTFSFFPFLFLFPEKAVSPKSCWLLCIVYVCVCARAPATLRFVKQQASDLSEACLQVCQANIYTWQCVARPASTHEKFRQSQ